MIVFLIVCLLAQAACSFLCLYQTSPHSRPNSQIDTSEFRSYHPQYLHSFSYATPSTFHFYFGRVEKTSLVFLIQQGFEGKEKEILIVNDHKRFLTSAFKEGLFSNKTKYMAVFSIEDSQEGHNQTATVSVERGKHVYSVLMANNSLSKAYILYFTDNNKTYPLEKVAIKLRDVSKTPQTNWNISRELKWNEEENQKQIGLATAIAMQIDTKNLDINMHFKEVKGINYKDKQQAHKQVLFSHDRMYFRHGYHHKSETCGEAAYNRLIEGLSYEYGKLRIVNGSLAVDNPPLELLSFSPSRKRFPWGFLWDDGFHNEVAVRGDKTLALKVIKSWLSTMIDGWIPRQQNRGKQREDLCNCELFMSKDIRDGNPPSLILSLQYLLRKKLLAESQLRPLWGKLKEWYSWYLRTQMVGQDTFLFKWFDHINSEGSFNSGLDDFPRPPQATYYIDTQSWMYYMSKVMMAVAEFLKEPSQQYANNTKKILDNLNTFLQPSSSTFRDVQDSFLSSTFSSQMGYPSLLPLAFGMLKSGSKEYIATINLITDPKMLNTSHGLSSITTSSSRYLQNQSAYWKGPVWINMNYLVLRGLRIYYPEEKEVYKRLRDQVVSTVCEEWKRTGYFYENYVGGKGGFSFPFNGWTSLINVISNETY